MLTVILVGGEVFNEVTGEFSTYEDFELHLEHSLLSLSKWEAKFEKPFLGKDNKSHEELLWYVEAMVLNERYPSNLWDRLSSSNLDAINKYIESPQSATTFGSMPEQKGRHKAEVITSELIYYWMVAFTIPFEVETWHLNRLFSLIKICNMKNSKPQKVSKHAIAQRNRELNEQRRKQLGTSG